MIPETYKIIPQYGCAAAVIDQDGKPTLITTPLLMNGIPNPEAWGEPYAGDTEQDDIDFLTAINFALNTDFKTDCLLI